MRILISLAFVIVSAHTLLAQYDAVSVRRSRTLWARYSYQSEAGSLRADAESAQVIWQKHAEDGIPDGSLQLPFSWHGKATLVVETAKRFLVCGWDPSGDGAGKVCVLECRDTPAVGLYQNGSTVDLGGMIDPIDIVWNSVDSRIYILDFKGKRILYAHWNGGGALPSQFSVAATSQTLPRLLDAEMMELELPSGKGGVAVRQTRLLGRLLSYPRIFHDGAAWRVQTIACNPYLNPPVGFGIRNKQATNSLGPLWLVGSPGPCRLFEFESGQLAATLSLPGGGDKYVPVNLPTGVRLVPGLRYGILWPDGSLGGTFRPLLRYGKPQSGGPMAVTVGRANPVRAYVGQSTFGVGCSIAASQALASPFALNVSAQLWIAARRDDGSDPVTLVGSAAILQPDNILQIGSYQLTPDNFTYGVAALQSIPNDPELAGNVILWQWVFSGGSGAWVAYSDVFGSTIFGVPPGDAMTQLASIRRSRATEGRLKAKAVKKARDWVKRLSPKQSLPLNSPIVKKIGLSMVRAAGKK